MDQPGIEVLQPISGSEIYIRLCGNIRNWITLIASLVASAPVLKLFGNIDCYHSVLACLAPALFKNMLASHGSMACFKALYLHSDTQP